MKNKIPLVIAVLLGLAAVFAVNRSLGRKAEGKEDKTTIVTAARQIHEGEVLTESALSPRVVPASALPAKAIPWNQRKTVENQKTKRAIVTGDYIQWSDIGIGRGIGEVVGEGEWAVSVNFPESAVTASLRPGDEIAIIATFNATVTVAGKTPGEKPVTRSRKNTAVLLPCVRIIGIGKNGSEVVLALPPGQAQTLIAAQREADLYPALRKFNDTGNMNRKALGLVDESTFSNLVQDVAPIAIPENPGQK